MFVEIVSQAAGLARLVVACTKYSMPGEPWKLTVTVPDVLSVRFSVSGAEAGPRLNGQGGLPDETARKNREGCPAMDSVWVHMPFRPAVLVETLIQAFVFGGWLLAWMT